MASLAFMSTRAIYHLYKAYNQTHLSWENLNCLGYPIFVSVNERIRNILRDFLNEQGIRNDLEIRNANITPAQAFGTNYFTGGYAAITLSPIYFRNNENGMIFIARHEIAHIKNNDLFKIHIISIIYSLSLMIFSFYVAYTYHFFTIG